MRVRNPAILRGAVTLGIGAAGGFAFFLFNLPLPWVLGSLTTSALVTQVSNFRPQLPTRWRSYGMVVIGTMLGTGFTQAVVARSASWGLSLVVMSLLSLVFCIFAYLVFRRWGGMNRETALFAAMPGGLSVVAMLAEQYKTEVNRVILCHTARLVVLLVSAPIVIQWLSGIHLADANQIALHSHERIDPIKHGILAIVAIASFIVANRVRLPSAMLLLPLLSSAVLHATGLLTVHVPPVFSMLAQIVIGSSVGARFANYTLRQIAKDGWLAALVGIFLAVGSLLGAYLVVLLNGGEIAPLFLAYLPGGAPELGVVALALMIDPAMVAAHHVLRVFLIVAVLPYAAARISQRNDSSH
ncbi:AbrB family transcriptional regulator [Antarcticimicrobium sediminis]|uniref:AbrB family transcriptional regulator n=2 Tax=Antarcticimicrobium sediminis TaxID=2546227 RepID=A0A4R5EJ97_9RHOB|nr:AbrB family transcriptional regulator [Antarcticimicrobium sediminis]